MFWARILLSFNPFQWRRDANLLGKLILGFILPSRARRRKRLVDGIEIPLSKKQRQECRKNDGRGTDAFLCSGKNEIVAIIFFADYHLKSGTPIWILELMVGVKNSSFF
jgi:hypothetical protein